jgi:hypothetical protein
VIGRKLFVSMAGVIALVLLDASAVAADRADVFAVSVPVDATAANANAARDTARLDGERRAYGVLLNRLTLASDRAKLPAASDSLLNDVIQGFEVANERRSTVRYLADYTFHFRADIVEKMLRNQGIPFAETPSKPLIVLAVLEGANGPVLWDDPNPWRDAWGNAKLVTGLVPLIVPLGQVEDVTAIDATAAESGDDARLQAIAMNYNDGDVLVTRAKIKPGDTKSVDVTSTRFTPGQSGREQTWVASFTANAGESDPDFLGRVVAATADQVAEAWKQANIIDYNQAGDLVVSVPISDLAGWLAVRDRLKAIASIQRMDVLSLDRQRALVTLHYVGSDTQLRLALAQRDLDLSGSDPTWELRRRGAAPPSAPTPAAGAPPAAEDAPPPDQDAPPPETTSP